MSFSCVFSNLHRLNNTKHSAFIALAVLALYVAAIFGEMQNASFNMNTDPVEINNIKHQIGSKPGRKLMTKIC